MSGPKQIPQEPSRRDIVSIVAWLRLDRGSRVLGSVPERQAVSLNICQRALYYIEGGESSGSVAPKNIYIQGGW